MSIESEINRISDNVSDALAATAEMGASVPATANSDNLGTLIRAIPKVNVVQNTGSSTADVMSQAAVTNAINSKADFVVTMTPSDDETIYITDATAEQIYEAYASGKRVYAIALINDMPMIMPLALSVEGAIGFSQMVGTDGHTFLMMFSGGNVAEYSFYSGVPVTEFSEYVLQTESNLQSKIDRFGDTMNGILKAQNNTSYTTKQVRNIALVAEGETLPSGANGDICLVYKP